MMDATSPAIKPAPSPERSASGQPRKHKRLFDRLLLALFLLFFGALSTLAISWALAFKIELADDPSLTGQGVEGSRNWTVQGWSGFGAMRLHSTRNVPNWSILEAVGPPDTPGAGDIATAWASATTDSQKEWLILDYEKPVIPKQIDVHETYNPGALEWVSVFNEAGQEVTVWQGLDPTSRAATRGVSQIRVPDSVNFKTSRVKIYLDSPVVSGWNEIDTVGLHDNEGNTFWPVNATASSSYGASPISTTTTGPETFLPSWCPLNRPGPDIFQHKANHEDRMIEARGWPMLAMWGERDLNLSAASSAKQSPQLLYSGFGGGGFGPAAPTRSTASVLSPLLPLHPIWRNFIINTIILAILFRLIYLSLAVPRRFVIELSRMRRGSCLKCGYQLGFDFRPGCPECGWRRSPDGHHPD
jgi:hypothetical protein